VRPGPTGRRAGVRTPVLVGGRRWGWGRSKPAAGGSASGRPESRARRVGLWHSFIYRAWGNLRTKASERFPPVAWRGWHLGGAYLPLEGGTRLVRNGGRTRASTPEGSNSGCEPQDLPRLAPLCLGIAILATKLAKNRASLWVGLGCGCGHHFFADGWVTGVARGGVTEDRGN